MLRVNTGPKSEKQPTIRWRFRASEWRKRCDANERYGCLPVGRYLAAVIGNAGTAPVAVVMISLNEVHNMEAVLRNLKGWAQEVFMVDSYSTDSTVDIALRHGVHVVQRAFNGFGDQWNFALRELPIVAPWTMKLDPDERISEPLKAEIVTATTANNVDGFTCPIRLLFMGRALPVRLRLTRLWRTGSARFSDVEANEHAHIDGRVRSLQSDIEHQDSPDLDHWLDKQNKYTTAEAVASFQGRQARRRAAIVWHKAAATNVDQEALHEGAVPLLRDVSLPLRGAGRMAGWLGGLCVVTPTLRRVPAVGIQAARDSNNRETSAEAARRSGTARPARQAILMRPTFPGLRHCLNCTIV